MDIRVDNMQQVNATTQTQQAQQSGEDFKFTLMSSIEEAGLSERLSVMMQEITGRKAWQTHGCPGYEALPPPHSGVYE